MNIQVKVVRGRFTNPRTGEEIFDLKQFVEDAPHSCLMCSTKDVTGAALVVIEDIMPGAPPRTFHELGKSPHSYTVMHICGKCAGKHVQNGPGDPAFAERLQQIGPDLPRLNCIPNPLVFRSQRRHMQSAHDFYKDLPVTIRENTMEIVESNHLFHDNVVIYPDTFHISMFSTEKPVVLIATWNESEGVDIIVEMKTPAWNDLDSLMSILRGSDKPARDATYELMTYRTLRELQLRDEARSKLRKMLGSLLTMGSPEDLEKLKVLEKLKGQMVKCDCPDCQKDLHSIE